MEHCSRSLSEGLQSSWKKCCITSDSLVVMRSVHLLTNTHSLPCSSKSLHLFGWHPAPAKRPGLQRRAFLHPEQEAVWWCFWPHGCWSWLDVAQDFLIFGSRQLETVMETVQDSFRCLPNFMFQSLWAECWTHGLVDERCHKEEMFYIDIIALTHRERDSGCQSGQTRTQQTQQDHSET